jgi:hypothetical protein
MTRGERKLQGGTFRELLVGLHPRVAWEWGASPSPVVAAVAARGARFISEPAEGFDG